MEGKLSLGEYNGPYLDVRVHVLVLGVDCMLANETFHGNITYDVSIG